MTSIVLTVASLGLPLTLHAYNMCGHYIYEILTMSQFITSVQCNTVQYNTSAMFWSLRKLIIFQFFTVQQERFTLNVYYRAHSGWWCCTGLNYIEGVPNILSLSFILLFFLSIFLAFSGFIDSTAEECDRKQGKRGGVTRSRGTWGPLQSLDTWVARATGHNTPYINLMRKLT